MSPQTRMKKKPPRARPQSVAGYMADLPPQSALVMGKIRGLVSKSVPGCTELVSYGIPAFKLERIFMYCAAFKSHIGIYPPVRNDARLMQRLKPHANARGNLRFALSEPIPYPLIARVARALAKSYVRPTLSFDIALAIGTRLPDVKGASGTRGMSLKVKGRLMACKAIHKSAEPDTLMIRISLKRRETLIKKDPTTYYLTDHYRPYPAVLVRLTRIGRAPLKELLTESRDFVTSEAR